MLPFCKAAVSSYIFVAIFFPMSRQEKLTGHGYCQRVEISVWGGGLDFKVALQNIFDAPSKLK